jgi:hypothetical protein
MGLSRLVTLPDWQGLGLAMILSDALGGAYKAIGKRMHTYPAHPSLIRSFDHSTNWHMTKRPGSLTPAQGRISSLPRENTQHQRSRLGGRPCAVFEYCGAASSLEQARTLLKDDT